jgi:hypothetical protein
MQHMFSQQGGDTTLETWLLLDSGSTCTVICNASLLQDIHSSKDAIRIRCNAGTKIVNRKGFLPLLQDNVWYAEGGIANIISLDDLCNHFVVNFIHSERMFEVIMPHGTLTFKKSKEGLFYYDTAEKGAMSLAQIFTPDLSHVKWNSPVDALGIPRINDPSGKMVNTTEHTAEGYTKREVQEARFVRLGQGRMACPSDVDYKHMVRYNVIKNCPVTPRQVTNATNIFGRNLQSTRGKPSGVDRDKSLLITWRCRGT